jgi:hypothetical protein
MSKKQVLAQKITAKMKKDAVKTFEKGLPDGRSTLSQMESWRTGVYEKLAQKGAARWHVFQDITT